MFFFSDFTTCARGEGIRCYRNDRAAGTKITWVKHGFALWPFNSSFYWSYPHSKMVRNCLFYNFILEGFKFFGYAYIFFNPVVRPWSSVKRSWLALERFKSILRKWRYISNVCMLYWWNRYIKVRGRLVWYLVNYCLVAFHILLTRVQGWFLSSKNIVLKIQWKYLIGLVVMIATYYFNYCNMYFF